MIRVIKKSGRIQSFNPEKIMRSVQNAAWDIQHTVSDKDAALITRDVERHILEMRKEEALSSSFELRALIWHHLREFGFHDVADSYMK